MDKSITLNRGGATRTIPSGFSWTTLLFGPIPSIIRWHWGFVWFGAAVNIAAIAFACNLDALAAYFPDFRIFIRFLILPMFFSGQVYCAAVRNSKLMAAIKKDGWRSESSIVSGVVLSGQPANKRSYHV